MPRSPASPSAPAKAGPPLTVLIPFHNLGRYLPRTLESLDRQTRRDFRIIMINDGSTDPESLSLLAHLARARPDLTIIHQENRGLSATRNAGLRAATTEWVMPLDADDLIAPTLIEKAMALVEAHPELTYASPMVSYFVEDPERPTGGWVPVGPDRDLLCVLNCAAAASGTVVRREAALAAGGYDEWMTSYEDWDLWCSLAKAGARGTIIPEFLLWYRVRPDSMYRTEATLRHTSLHAHLLERHATLPADPGRVLRLLAASGDGELDAQARARAIVAENIRYRMADRVNDTLKRTGIQRAIKGLTVRVLGARKRSRR
jgi:GT2 family glycosyltransferase